MFLPNKTIRHSVTVTAETLRPAKQLRTAVGIRYECNYSSRMQILPTKVIQQLQSQTQADFPLLFPFSSTQPRLLYQLPYITMQKQSIYASDSFCSVFPPKHRLLSSTTNESKSTLSYNCPNRCLLCATSLVFLSPLYNIYFTISVNFGIFSQL